MTLNFYLFWTEAVSTACYVLNRVSITNPHNKTPYELISGKVPQISHLKPFGCQVTILNTSDYLGKFEGKADEGYLVGYASNSKAYRVYNLPNKRVEETLNLRFLEDKPNVQGIGHEWYFDLDYLTDSLGNTKNDRILQTPSSNLKNKVEAHPRNVKSSLNKKNGNVNVHGSAVVQNLKKQDNSDYVCIHRDDCMPSDNLCVSNAVNVVKSRAKSKKNKSKKDIWKPTGKVFTQIGYIWRPTGRTFTIVGNACPLTRITTTIEVPFRKPIVLECESHKPVVKLVYSKKPRKNKNIESVSKTK
ncbi:retrovirus-related pol polyprotein from transposon TNT 1-94, partial [Tanacetum coccineum]